MSEKDNLEEPDFLVEKNTTIKKYEPKGFIETYIHTWDIMTDAPKESQEACALTLLSTCAGRNASIITGLSKSVTNMLDKSKTPKVSGFPLNVWFILLGKSRLSRKTTAITPVEDMFRNINKNLMLSAVFTPQAITEELHKRGKTDKPQIAWINDEVSGFFQMLKNQKFMASVDALLSRLYDCRYYTGDLTLNRGRVDIENPYICMLLASTQHLPTLFDEQYMIQGFANRFIYVDVKRIKFKPEKVDVPQEVIINTNRMNEWLKNLYEVKEPVCLILPPKSLKKLNDFTIKVEEEIDNDEVNSLSSGWIGNMPEFVKKLAGLYALSDLYDNEEHQNSYVSLLTEPAITIKGHHIDRAIERISIKGRKDYEKVIFLMKTKKESKTVRTEEASIEMVYSYIKTNGIHGIKTKELYKLTSYKKKELDSILEALILQDRIKLVTKQQTSGAGAPSRIYKCK